MPASDFVPVWFLLALLAAFFIASSDAVAKRFLHDYSALELGAVRLCLAGVMLWPIWLFLPNAQVGPDVWPWMVFAVPLELLAMYFYARGIQSGALAVSLPYLSFTPIFVVLVGWLLLGESVSVIGLLGIVLVVVGAVVLNLGPLARAEHRVANPAASSLLRLPQRLLQGVARSPASRNILLVAMIYSLTAVAGKGALAHASDPLSFAVFYFGSVAMVGILALMVVKPNVLRVIFRRPTGALLTAGLMAAMAIAHFLAIAEVQTAYMMSVKRLSPLIAILYGYFWFHERGLRHNLVSAGLMVIGAAIVMLG